MIKRFTIVIVVFNLLFTSVTFASDTLGPSVAQQAMSGVADATNSSVLIDIYYEISDETGVDENKIPETFLRLPGFEDSTSLRSKPTLISGDLKRGSWLARFSYSKGIRPGVYLASTGLWVDNFGNQSLLTKDVTIRIDNFSFGEPENNNAKPSAIKCTSGQQNYDSKTELMGYVLCNYNANSIKNQVKLNLTIKKVPQNATSPIITLKGSDIYSPINPRAQKASFNFGLTNFSSGIYTVSAAIEFLGHPELTIVREVVLQTPNYSASQDPKSSAEEFSTLAASEVLSWNEKIGTYAKERNLPICFELPTWILPQFSEDKVKNQDLLKNFQTSLYGKVFSDTQQRIERCLFTNNKDYYDNQVKVIAANFATQIKESLEFTSKCLEYIASKNPIITPPLFTDIESENLILLEKYKNLVNDQIEIIVKESKFKFDPICIPTEKYYKSVTQDLFIRYTKLMLEKYPKSCSQIIFPPGAPSYLSVLDAFAKGGPEAAETRVDFYRRLLESRFVLIPSEIAEKCKNSSGNPPQGDAPTGTVTSSIPSKEVKSVVSNKKITIICVRGKVSKKITAVKPSCPIGYIKK